VSRNFFSVNLFNAVGICFYYYFQNRRQASIKAMKNAKKIGFDLARSCNLALSKPICINEESSQIREGIFLDQHSQDHPKSINEMIEERTVSANVAIKVTFELRAKPKELADCSKLN